jgi:hypothetical protein
VARALAPSHQTKPEAQGWRIPPGVLEIIDAPRFFGIAALFLYACDIGFGIQVLGIDDQKLWLTGSWDFYLPG